MEVLDNFVNRLLEERGIEKLEPEILSQARKDLRERLDDKIRMAMLFAMPSPKLEEFKAMMATASDAEVQKFCQDNIVNLDEVVSVALYEFRQTFLGK